MGNPDETRTREADFSALWSSDGVTRSFAPSPTGGIPADLPFLFAAGQRFGAYQIVRPIGKGGMGQVYEAEESDSGRRVAIKILSRGIGDEEERERFLQEGRLAASLSHPNTVYVFGTTEVQGFPVIAMELAPSGTLKDLVGDSPLPFSRAVDAVLQVVEGLQAAAAIGILHRDVKPSNCFVAGDGRVLVGDFGLSIPASAHAAGSGTILGTPGFASPEQLRGGALDVRADIYSVGATLFYLLAGRAPFEDHSTTGLLDKVASQPPPSITALRPEVPQRLSHVIARCLAKEPAARFVDYAALIAALEPFSSATQAPAPLIRRVVAGAIDAYITGLPAALLTPWLGLFPLSPSHWIDAMTVSALNLSVMTVYYGLLEGRWGASAGKALMGLRVVDRTQTTPSVGRAVGRALAFALPAQIIVQTITWLMVRRIPDIAVSAIDAATGTACLVVLFSTARPSNGYLGLHDRISQTRVVRRRARREVRDRLERVIGREASPPPDGGSSVGPFRVPSGVALPVTEAVTVDGFDDRLGRHVRIDLLPPGTAPLQTARRDLDRPTRARWLGGRRSGDECWDAYEALDGEPFERIVAVPHRWSRVRHWLADLTAEIIAGSADGTLPPLNADNILVGRDGRVRLLDPPQGVTDGASQTDLAISQRFLYAVTTAALLGAAAEAAAELAPTTPLPLTARKVLLSLRAAAFTSANDLARAVKDATAAPAALSRQRRAVQIGVVAALPIMLTVVSLGAILALNRQKPQNQRILALQTCLNLIEEGEKSSKKTDAKTMAMKEDSEIYIAEHLAAEVHDPNTWASSFPNLAQHGGRDRAYRALAAHTVRRPEEVRRADATIVSQIAHEESGLARLTTWAGLWSTGIVIAAGTSVIVIILSVIGAIVTGSGFTFRPAGAALVNRRGQPISRLRALWRVVVCWTPIAATLVLSRPGALEYHPGLLLAQTMIMAAMVGAAGWAIVRPSRGLQDRLAGTWIVPR